MSKEEQPISITDPDLDVESAVKNPNNRRDLLLDASKIFAAKEIANGVPFSSVETNVRRRSPNLPRGQARSTIQLARDLVQKFNK